MMCHVRMADDIAHVSHWPPWYVDVALCWADTTLRDTGMADDMVDDMAIDADLLDGVAGYDSLFWWCGRKKHDFL